MPITTRPTRNGRVIVESDGCSNFYGGALVQGATICKISAPAAIVDQYRDADGGIDLRRFVREIRGNPGIFNLRGVRVLELRYVE